MPRPYSALEAFQSVIAKLVEARGMQEDELDSGRGKLLRQYVDDGYINVAKLAQKIIRTYGANDGVYFEGALTLDGLHFENANLTNLAFGKRVTLKNCTLLNCNLSGLRSVDAITLDNCDLRGSTLNNLQIQPNKYGVNLYIKNSKCDNAKFSTSTGDGELLEAADGFIFIRREMPWLTLPINITNSSTAIIGRLNASTNSLNMTDSIAPAITPTDRVILPVIGTTGSDAKAIAGFSAFAAFGLLGIFAACSCVKNFYAKSNHVSDKELEKGSTKMYKTSVTPR